MGTTYIISGVGKLGRESQHLVMKDVEGNCNNILPSKTDQLVVVGNVSISGDALRLLAQKKIPTIFVAKNGMFNSRLEYGQSKNIFARQAQFRLCDDKNQALKIACSIVMAKIKNQLSFMQKNLGNLKEECGQDLVKDMHNLMKRVGLVTNMEELRGVEGMASRTFYSFMKMHIIPEWAIFNRRSKNPPLSNVNAVLSFLYTILGSKVRCGIELTGLDPMVGTLHELAYGRDALVYDLVEEFRTPVADAVCCSLFNLGILAPEDFRLYDFETEEETPGVQEVPESAEGNLGIMLMESGMKKVLQRFEEKLATEISYGKEQRRLSYEQIIFEQAAHYKQVLLGDANEYKGYEYR